MLYEGFRGQARHGHMSDEYKRYIIITLLKPLRGTTDSIRDHSEFPYLTELEGDLIRHN